MPDDKVDAWIRSTSGWKSFVDIGGIGENSCNERITAACAAGGERVVMADLEPFDHNLWVIFREKMKEQGVSGFQEYEKIDVRDPEALSRLGKFDFVHSTGINYHLPDPVMGVYNIGKITNRYLVTNTLILPDVVENEYGRIEMGPSQVMFLPAVTEKDRAILRKHYKTKFGWDFNDTAPRLDDPSPMMPYVTNAGLSCYPYWWLFSAEAFRSLLRRLGFRVLDEYLWEDHALGLFCERAMSLG